jgi:hypothetical protein
MMKDWKEQYLIVLATLFGFGRLSTGIDASTERKEIIILTIGNQGKNQLLFFCGEVTKCFDVLIFWFSFIQRRHKRAIQKSKTPNHISVFIHMAS